MYVETFNVAAMDHCRAAMCEEGAQRVLCDQVLQLGVDACALGSIDDGARFL